MSPHAITIRETPIGDGPTRRILYERRSDGHFERREQLWRQSIAGWHTTGCELVGDVTVECAEDR